jgi:hypothetical protein
MFSTRMRADWSLPAYSRIVSPGKAQRGEEEEEEEHRHNTSRSCAISRRCCLALAESFCCTMRRRDMDSLSCTLSLFCGCQHGDA